MIDAEGKVTKVYNNVKAKGHAEKVPEALLGGAVADSPALRLS